VLKLRCLFLKMRSLLEVPLLRMGQARSPALAATSRVYSSALVAFSRRLLQVPPYPPMLCCIITVIDLHSPWFLPALAHVSCIVKHAVWTYRIPARYFPLLHMGQASFPALAAKLLAHNCHSRGEENAFASAGSARKRRSLA